MSTIVHMRIGGCVVYVTIWQTQGLSLFQGGAIVTNISTSVIRIITSDIRCVRVLSAWLCAVVRFFSFPACLLVAIPNSLVLLQ